MPEPSITLATPTFEVSDYIARAKTKRLMDELYAHGNEQTWHRINRDLGITAGKSQKKKWDVILELPNSRKDVIGTWLDKDGDQMPQSHPKKTAEVMVFMLAVGTPNKIGEEPVDDADKALYLSSTSYERRDVLHPERTPSENRGMVFTLLKVTFHSLQRIMQRGYALSDQGEISYKRLLELLFCVWADADDECDLLTDRPATLKLAFAEAIFVVKVPEGSGSLDLVTVLPPNK
jgi:hypothetical protein